jgi:hypothetical protein
MASPHSNQLIPEHKRNASEPVKVEATEARIAKMREALMNMKVTIPGRAKAFEMLRAISPSTEFTELLERIEESTKTALIARITGDEAVRRVTSTDFVPETFHQLVRLLALPNTEVGLHCPGDTVPPSIHLIRPDSEALSIKLVRPEPHGLTCLLTVNPDYTDIRQYFRLALHGPDVLRPAAQRILKNGEKKQAFFSHGEKLDGPIAAQEFTTGVSWF